MLNTRIIKAKLNTEVVSVRGKGFFSLSIWLFKNVLFGYKTVRIILKTQCVSSVLRKS